MATSEFWILAAPTPEEGRESTYSLLKSRLQSGKIIDFSAVFEVPLTMKFGRLDDLVRLADDLVKQDSFVEQACRRLEKLGLEIDPNAEFRILWQRNALSAEQYLGRFIWDEARYPRSRLVKQNVELIVSSVAKLDEEVRVKASLFNELRSATQDNSKQDSLSFAVRDLTDVLTPGICSDNDFVDTEHLKTVVAVVPRGEVAGFSDKFWRLDDKIVPFSEVKFSPVDKDGSSLFAFIVFKSKLEDIKNKLKEHRIIVRDFTYSESAFRLKTEERGKLDAERSKQESVLSRICLAAFSECFVAWVHLKAIRVFVEATLRYGVPPKFSAFIVRGAPRVKEGRLRKELDEIFASKYNVGQHYFGTKDEGDVDDADYFSYVSLSVVPFVQFIQR